MKYIYAFISTILLAGLVPSCTDSRKSDILGWTKNDFSDINIYEGSETGGVKLDSIPIPSSVSGTVTDTAKWYMNNHFNGVYEEVRYSSFEAEFLDDNLMLYTHPVRNEQLEKGNQLLSNYEFIGDSLFIYKTDSGKAEKIFVARGTKDELYREAYFYSFVSKTTGLDSLFEHTEKIDLQMLLDNAGYKNLEEMKSKSNDRISWANIRYVFKR